MNEPYERIATLALEAADALWALDKGKKPDREPRAINYDIYQFFREYGYPESDAKKCQ